MTEGSHPMKKSFRSEVIPLSEVPRGIERGGSDRPVVLVVDDEPLVAETLALILKGVGFTAIPLNSGYEALDLAYTVRPAFLLTDVHMPGLTGVELALMFRKGFPDCKVLLFSGKATAKDMEPAIAAGIEFPMLLKPVHPTQIIDYISKSLAEGSNESVPFPHRFATPASSKSA